MVLAERITRKKCTKNFPKDFSETTDINVYGYPIYRRRNDGRTVTVKGVEIYNRWVVPYNPYLSRKYQAHINVEVCSSIQSVKYIFKYIYKGHDAAVVEVSETVPGTYDWDEVQKFLDTRYISAPEAMWRLHKYEMHSRSHSALRMYSVSPKERYCVKLLLSHKPGAQSFDDRKTIDGILYASFLEAAKALNLLEDDEEWNKAMEEASFFRMPGELRQLIAMILIHAHPTDSNSSYDKLKYEMYEDYLQDHNEETAENLALLDIQNHLMQFDKHCQYFGLPSPVNSPSPECCFNSVHEQQEADRLRNMMNTEQRTACDIIMEAVDGRSPQRCFFLSGASGCGKTFVYNLASTILGRGQTVRCVAPNGLASTLLKCGKTVHSGFGISIHLTKDTTSSFKENTLQWKELAKVKLLIWDEISMCHIHLFILVDRTLRDIKKSDEPFGGIPIVVGGDFRQLAPVILNGNRVNIVEACVKSSHLWKYFTQLNLITNMRVQKDENDFTNWLLSIGSGTENGKDSDFAKIPAELLCDDLLSSIFGESIQSLKPDEIAARAILCPKNDDTLKINEEISSRLCGDQKTYFSVDTIADAESEEERTQYPIEILNSFTPMGLPPHLLRLKKGCCVTLLRNLNPKRGLCNGTRLIVEALGTNLIECSIFTGQHKGSRVFSDLLFQLNRKQFPLRLAYSMTITKSQGQTFDRIGVYLPEPVFTHGQLYTAFSRVRSKDGLFIKIRSGSRQGVIFENDSNTYTYNCVYREIS